MGKSRIYNNEIIIKNRTYIPHPTCKTVNNIEGKNQIMESIRIDFLKQLSIRARLAYAARCLEVALAHQNVCNELLERVINDIWKFTDTNLDDWARIATKYFSDVIVDYHYPVSEYPSFSLDELEELRKVYSELPEFILSIIDNTIEIGMMNLYSDVTGDSPETLEPLIIVVETMVQCKVGLPSIKTFLKSPFQELDGWGKQHSKKFYLE
ncbi:hypothetical protein [Chitinophaga skermanii]|nr:hypothetical protein [Chitinophaga skermanii]